MSKSRLIVALIILFAVGTLGMADIASACDQQCQKVAPFCRQCVDTGTYTGATCQSSGSCGCFYTLNTCGTLAAKAPAAKADFLAAENSTPAQAPPAVELAFLFVGQ